jgi:spore germination cell wall hydrolase CwlJ-like protein
MYRCHINVAAAIIVAASALSVSVHPALADGEVTVEDELSCLARGIYFEARGEPVSGQFAVGRVILNRVNSPAYPDTVCGVVYQNAHRKNACQFSFACDGIQDRIDDFDSWGRILERAATLLVRRSECSRITASTGLISISTNYHATYVSPRWAKALVRTGRIGQHIFYYEERVGDVKLASDGTVADRPNPNT